MRSAGLGIAVFVGLASGCSGEGESDEPEEVNWAEALLWHGMPRGDAYVGRVYTAEDRTRDSELNELAREGFHLMAIVPFGVQIAQHPVGVYGAGTAEIDQILGGADIDAYQPIHSARGQIVRMGHTDLSNGTLVAAYRPNVGPPAFDSIAVDSMELQDSYQDAVADGYVINAGYEFGYASIVYGQRVTGAPAYEGRIDRASGAELDDVVADISASGYVITAVTSPLGTGYEIFAQRLAFEPLEGKVDQVQGLENLADLVDELSADGFAIKAVVGNSAGFTVFGQR
ncbi:MAG: hypothetical protein R3F61_04430 [Myxococcota bacterium]